MQEHHLVHTGWISCDQWVGKPVNDILEQFVRVLTVAIQRWPSVVVLDDIDKIIPVVPDSDLPGQLRVKHILARLSDVVSAASTKFRQIPFAILATCTSSTPNPALHNTRLFTKVIKLPAVDAPARIDILNKCLKAYGTVTLHEEVTLADIALVTEGYVGRDLRQLISRTMHAVAVRASDCHGPSQFTVIAEDLTAALEGFVPGSLRNVTLQKSDISWADIGGLTHAKSMLKETLELPSKFRDIFAQVPLKLRSGLLLYGPPGCGKTLLASAVAKECGLNFISVKGPELLNKYIGQSEQGVRDVFDRAATAAPAILFFDEFEAIAPKRGGESTGVTDRVVNQFLCQLDGVEGRSGVYVLAASSRPDMIDPALLRPGRLDKAI
jgi:peroxin-1